MKSLEKAVKNAKPTYKLTRKQKAFADELINNPKISATQAALKHYGKSDKPISYDTARNISSENLAKPSVISYLAQKNDLVEEVLINTLTDWGREQNTRKREIAVDVGKYVHDKIHGKATQRVEQSTRQVTISIDLTGQEDDTDTAQTTG